MRRLLLLLVVCTAVAQEAPDPLKAAQEKLRGRHYAASVELFTKAIAKDPASINAYYGRALAREALKDYEGAAADHSKVVEINPRAILSFWRRGRMRQRIGDFKGAIEDYTKMTEARVSWAPGWTARAAAKVVVGDFKGALGDYEAAIYSDEKNGGHYCNRGRAQLLSGDLEAAKKSFQRGVELSPGKASVFFARARFYHHRGMWKEARADLKRSIGLDPGVNNEYARLFLCTVSARLGDREESVQQLTAYVAKRPAKDDWFTKVAAFLAGKLEEEGLFAAARDKNKYVRREQECEAYWYAGVLRLAAGDRERAKAYFRKCVATEAKDFVEYDAAVAELKRMSSG